MDINPLPHDIFEDEYDNGDVGAAKTLDWNTSLKQKITLQDWDCVLTFTAPVGPCDFTLKVVQGEW